MAFLYPVLHGVKTPYSRNLSEFKRSDALVISKISTNPKKHFAYLKPIADYVVSHMKDLGIMEARVVLAKDTKQMIEYIISGKVDWITETPFAASIFHEQAGARMLLRRWKKGVPEYHTVLSRLCRE